MSKKISGMPSKTLAKVSRRKRVIEILTKQLTVKTKRVFCKETKKYSVVPLEEKDINRIKKELEILNSRI